MMMPPNVKQLWNASDANAKGSGAALEREVEAQFAQAVQSGKLDPMDSMAVTQFLSGLGVTPEKGGGRYLYNKLTGAHGAPSIASRHMAMAPSVNPAAKAQQMGQQALTNRYGSASLGSFARPSEPPPMGMPDMGDGASFDFNSWRR
jgi:hypothetical protein